MGGAALDAIEAEAGAGGGGDARAEPPRDGAMAASVPGSRRPGILQPRFDLTGVMVGGLLCAASLFPSLLPRTSTFQGLLSGITMALGYGLGAALSGLWRFLQIPWPRGRARTVLVGVAAGLVSLALAAAVWHYAAWQDDQRARMGMPSIGAAGWPTMLLIAVAVATVLLVLGRLLRALFRVVIGLFNRRLPHRLAVVLGLAGVTVLLVTVYNDMLVRAFWAGTTAAFAPQDDIQKEGVTGPPTSPERSGGPGSLVTWQSLGREGRAFVSLGPSRQDLAAATPAGETPREPIRVFVGLKSAPTLQQRADLVLAELQRTDAFEREVLVLATTTGSGFLDPAGIDPLEHPWHGDTAVAGLQYSYLPSWLSLLADQQTVQEAAQAVFHTVYAYWRTLPADARPDLYLYGLSLGSFGVQSVLTDIELLNEPVAGALMVGPPFVNPLHANLTERRDAGSPVWQPIYQQGRTVRFSARPAAFDQPSGPWGPVRIAYLQHDTDPVVWFSPTLLTREPAWLEDGERGPNISPEFAWTPGVTMWQVLFDLAAAGSAPWGYGHLYLPSENARAWVGVTDPPGWTAAQVDALGAALDANGG